MTPEELKELEPLRQKTEVYARVCGYMRPVDQWNEGKQNEFHDRKNFNVTD